MKPASALGRWLPPLGCAAVFVLASPFVGALREALKARFGLGYLKWLAAALALAGLSALAAGIVRIRDHRALRYSLVAVAGAMVTWQVAAWGVGTAEVDVVERVHLVEFGLLGALFERAFRGRHRNVLLPALVLLSVGLVGLADEWTQWLTPVRTGDGRDVLLNLWAGGIGYWVGVALSAERGRLRRPGPQSRRLAVGLWALFACAAAAFFDQAHLGYEIRDPVAGVFRSWYTADELARLAAERDRRWGATGVPEGRPLAIEDPYLTEAGFHLMNRDRASSAGFLVRAWRENRILERWYAPLLEYRPESRWPKAQRVNTEAAVRAHFRRVPVAVIRAPGYRSPALADRIAVTPPRGLFWLAALISGGIPPAMVLAPVVRWPSAGRAERGVTRKRRRPHSLGDHREA